MAESSSHSALIVAFEDEEMSQYRKNSLNAVTFHTVFYESDLEVAKKCNQFKPEMAHQVFGEKEMIFGYKQLTIDLYYLHNSARCYVDVKYSDKIEESAGCAADDIMGCLNPWLPTNFTVDREEFKESLKNEDHSLIFGEVFDSFEDSKGRKYKLMFCERSEEFKEFHQRFETYIVWFIDGANFIDLEDERWTFFYVYEEFSHPTNKKICYSPVGFCTVYKFFLYPEKTRPRISQFFILPTHQRRGIGTKLYSSVFSYLKDLPDAGDITVEEPTELFQKIRDFCDSLAVYKSLQENKISITTQNQKQIAEFLKRHKICKRQSQRVFDILECLISHKNGYQEYVKFTKSIKARIESEIERETRGSKRLCNSERNAVATDPVDKSAIVQSEYGRYIDSLEWPTNKLRAFLSNN